MNNYQTYLKHKHNYLNLKNQLGSGYNQLPGSLFQLLELLCKLPYEISIEVNKNTEGTITLFLTKGFAIGTDYLHESRTSCGIHIHTHYLTLPQRRPEYKFWPPSSQDIYTSIGNIYSNKTIFNWNQEKEKIPQLKYDYLFDGYNLWYYKPNSALVTEYVELSESLKDAKLKNVAPYKIEKIISKQQQLLSYSAENADMNALALIGLSSPSKSLEQYLDSMKDLLNQKSTDAEYPDEKVMGFDIGIISNWKHEKEIIIPDYITCNMNERRDNHIILPIKDLLNNEELDLLYQKSIKILEKKTITKESPI